MSFVEDPDAIWWTEFCGNTTIYDAFWSTQLTVNTSSPELTSCFEHTVLMWIPNVLLLLCLIFYIPFVSSLPIIHRLGTISPLNLSKMLLNSILLVMSGIGTVDMFVRYTSDEPLETTTLPACIGMFIQTCGLLACLCLTHWVYRHGRHMSGLLFCYWFLMVLCGGLRTISYFNHPRDIVIPGRTDFEYIIFFIFYAFIVILFGFTILSDLPAMRPTMASANSQMAMVNMNDPSFYGSQTFSKVKNEAPRDRAGFFSILVYGWFFPMIWTGYRRALKYADIWDIRENDSSYVNVNRFRDNWDKELLDAGYLKGEDGSPRVDGELRGSPSIWRVLLRCYGWRYMGGGLIQLCQALLDLVNPLIMGAVIDYVSGGDPYKWHGYIMAATMFFVSAISSILLQFAMDNSYNIGLRVRTSVIGTIYRKTMRLTTYSRGTISAGEITNMMSVDAQKMQDLWQFLHYMWIAPITVSIGTYLLWQRVGVAALAGISFHAVVVPTVAIITSKFIRQMQIKQMKYKDARIKLMNQILNGIKVLKLYAWEGYFEKRIREIRETEVDTLRFGGKLTAVNTTTTFSSQFIAALLTYITYIYAVGDGVLTADVTFVALSLLNALSFPLFVMPQAIQSILQGTVSVNRIKAFLLAEEVDPLLVKHDYVEGEAISIEGGNFSWGEEKLVLSDVNVVVPKGCLVAVVGMVGSGKSSLISAILGEMQTRSGRVNVNGSISYVPQQAWIQNMTVRDNILFSKPFMADKYQSIMDACALKDDLKILSAGDQTEIGERGINLSGGQKQRISIARSIYQNADLYLFDDPLSAVDSHVGKHIFDKVLGPMGLLRNRTRVLVTNSVNFLPQCDMIISLGHGTVAEKGTFDELLSHDGVFADYIKTYLQEVMEEGNEEELLDDEARQLFRRLSSVAGMELTRSMSRQSIMRGSLRRRRRSETVDEEPKKDTLIAEEVAEEGIVKMSVIGSYLKAMKAYLPLLAAIGFVMVVGGSVGGNIWLSYWSDDIRTMTLAEAQAKVPLRIGVYAAFGATQILGMVILLLGVVYGTMSAAMNLHNSLLTNVLKSPMSFFDTTPLGRIINRFSKDIDTMDMELRMFIQLWLTQVAPVIATIIVISYSTPIFLAAFIPLAIIFVVLQRFYVTTARQLKRIDAIKRSPVYNNFGETLSGITSIRAYGVETRFVDHADELLDNNQKVWFSVYSSARWGGLYAQFIGNLVIFFTSIFCVISRDSLAPGLAGAALSYALQISFQMVLVMRTTAELETYIVSVERVNEYITTPQEAPWYIDGKRPPAKWPADGQVVFSEYCTRYREGLDLVLKGVDCTIKPGEKVGIVGRTGAGKSTITLALFRLIEPASGTMSIDGIDIAHMGLHDIRSKITIIPQDPVVFSGSLRFNTDPGSLYTDKEIWGALEMAHLKATVTGYKEGLDYECGEEGQNLSVGERQLVCLARALLRRTKILVLDEATAAIDLATDDLVQNTIRTAFSECTVLTIAHRLNTIMDSDRVMVMDKGIIAEFASPSELLANRSSIFFGMAKDAGLVGDMVAVEPAPDSQPPPNEESADTVL